MNPEIREKYNSLFSEKQYEKFLENIQSETNNRLDFTVSETPLFLTNELTEELVKASNSILSEIRKEDFLKNSNKSIPPNLVVANEDEHPIFLQIDFGITKTEEGEYFPQLIELQGFPSIYAYQAFIEKKVREYFYVPEKFTAYYNGLNFDSYIDLFKKTLLGNSSPENVILLEIEPEKQKTRIDFYLTEKHTGVKSICISDIIKHGNKLFYKLKGKETPIERIYNRVIFDELIKKEIKYNYNLNDNLDVTWVGHPNWFYKISKFSLPLINSKYSPKCYYLSDLEKYPDDLENYVLKPLFSFAGSGVVIDVTKEILDKIKDKENYILQKKVNYEPLIKTPNGYAKAEIRMMFIWNEEPLLVNNLLRTSKGKMMGVDFNKNQTWIGSNTVFHPIV
jgi:hypothetical protein